MYAVEVREACVGDPGAIVAGDGNVAEDGELTELMADTVHEHDLDAEAAEDGDVDEEIVKILVSDDGSVDRDDENLALKTRDVFEDAAQIVGLERGGAEAGREEPWPLDMRETESCAEAERRVNSLAGSRCGRTFRQPT